MKILSLHCDYIKFKPLKKALKSAELEKGEEGEKEVKEALVILTAVEQGDSLASIPELIKNIKDIAGQVKAKHIVLYPYAHLSSSLSNPEIALAVLKEAEKELKAEKFTVTRAPFGYYKEFELKVKGHPLSELSRTIGKEIISGKTEEKEEVFTEEQRLQLVRKLSKIKTSSEKGLKGLKSNVELGREMDLYLVSEVVGPGLPLLTPKGATIKRELDRFITDEELKRGYQYTATPVMAKSDLYKISGHWQHYKDSMFILPVGNETFALRPMTCPFQFIIYKSQPRSYKDLPIKYAEISNLFRNEKSGELMGLTRLRQFTLSDAHVICRPDQLEEEFEKVLDLIKYTSKVLGIDNVWYRFSKWDPKNKEKYIDDPKAWDASQKSMKKILDKLKLKYKEADNEAAFYGPKLDIQFENVFGKEDTLLTVQIDFALPERFDMTYADENNEQKRPMVIHRSSIGCLERVMAYLLEKTQGNLPTWLSPIQVRVANFTDRNLKASEKVVEQLKEAGIRVDADLRNNTVEYKTREAEMQKVPYFIVIGDKEEQAGTLAVRKTGKAEKPKFGVKLKDFIDQIKDEISKRQ